MMSVHRSVLIYRFLLGCSILLATATKDTEGADPCPTTFSSVTHWNDSSLQVGCYTFTSTDTFEGAKDNCKNMGGSLVGDDSVYQQQSLAKFYKKNWMSKKVWIGAMRDTSVDKWKWIYSKQKVTFNSWRTGEPNNHGGSKNCILWDGDETWDAASCYDSTPKVALCQYYGEQGEMLGEWSAWSEASFCSKRCGGGKQSFKRSRSCFSAVGCDRKLDYDERDCRTQDCKCDLQTVDKKVILRMEDRVYSTNTIQHHSPKSRLLQDPKETPATFCSKFPGMISNDNRKDFCGFSKTQKLEALLCKDITSKQAEDLLNLYYTKTVSKCKYDPTEVFVGDCGQLLQDKLSKSCDDGDDCDTIQSTIVENIDKAMNETDELYTNKLDVIDIMEYFTEELEYLNTDIESNQPEDIKMKQKEIMENVVDKLKMNANMGEDEKNSVKAKAFELWRRNAVAPIDARAESDRLKQKRTDMESAKTRIKGEYNKIKANIQGTSNTDRLEDVGTAVGHVLSSIEKFKKGDTMSVIGGVLDIAAGISQFFPTASIFTETISTIFNLFSGESAPTTESVIKDEFKKQKEFLEKKFNEVEKRFTLLDASLRNYFDNIAGKIDKSLAELKRAIESITIKVTESQKELLLMMGLKEMRRNALGLWNELDIKLKWIISNEGEEHGPHALTVIQNNLGTFRKLAEEFVFRDFVKTECKNKTSTKTREDCQFLAYLVLMIDRTEEILLTKTMAILKKSNSHGTLKYGTILNERKKNALNFFNLIFTCNDKNKYSYLSCGLSEKSNVKLTDEQKSNLFVYAKHLDPKGDLENRMKERTFCVDGNNILPWKVYTRSSPEQNAALDKEMRECCENEGKKLEIPTCSEPKHGGVDCPHESRCHGHITLRYCPDGNPHEIIPGTVLRNNDALTSPNGKFKLVMQTDGDLVFYSTGKNIWSTYTKNTCPNAFFLFNNDGNMAIYNGRDQVCWSSHTRNTKAGKLTITDDNNLILKDKDFENPIWKMTDSVYCSVKEDLSGILEENNWRTLNEIYNMDDINKRDAVIFETAKMTGHTTEDLKDRKNTEDRGSLTAIANIAAFLIKYGIRRSSKVKTMTYEPALRNTLISYMSRRFSMETRRLHTLKDFDLLKTFCSQPGVHHRETRPFTLDGGYYRSVWGPAKKCSFPHFVSKMDLKYSDEIICLTYGTDYCAPSGRIVVNAIRLTCSDGTTITSTEGTQGWYHEKWKECDSKMFINGATMNKNKKGDNPLAANGIKFTCDGSTDEYIAGEGDGSEGKWQEWQSCEEHSAIIGLRTMLAPDINPPKQNTVINKVEFYCASLL